MHRSKDSGELEDEDEREAEAELVMLGFVMPDFHAEKGSETTSQKGNGEEAGFRDTPFVMPRLPFVNAIQEERDNVYRREIKQNAIYHIPYITHYTPYITHYTKMSLYSSVRVRKAWA